MNVVRQFLTERLKEDGSYGGAAALFVSVAIAVDDPRVQGAALVCGTIAAVAAILVPTRKR